MRVVYNGCDLVIVICVGGAEKIQRTSHAKFPLQRRIFFDPQRPSNVLSAENTHAQAVKSFNISREADDEASDGRSLPVYVPSGTGSATVTPHVQDFVPLQYRPSKSLRMNLCVQTAPYIGLPTGGGTV